MLDAATERITSALPDFQGRIWFVSKKNGKVGALDPKTGEIEVITLGEEIENSFAVGERRRLHRLRQAHVPLQGGQERQAARRSGRSSYQNSGIVKPSQVNAGSGTTPTIMDGGYVAITDNADPMNVVVYRTATQAATGQKRMVCEVPVFEKGASATENSLIAAGRSLIVENNYGYQDPFGPNAGAVTEPGFARVDVEARTARAASSCWTNNDVRAPTVVPKLSTKTGLIYTYTRPPDPSGPGLLLDRDRLRAPARPPGSKYAGSGLSFNNNYAGLALGPTAPPTSASIGGIVALRDGP